MLEVKRKPSSRGSGTVEPSSVAPLNRVAQAAKSTPRRTTSITEGRDFQTKLPVVIGEIHFRGTASVDGIVIGQVGGGNALGVKQRSSTVFASEPELVGEISFRDMIRVNGHIAGTVCSQKGTLIVDTSAKLEADIDVAVALIAGTVSGDIVAHERVELGPSSKIYGNIWTRSIVIRDGAIFEGACRMIEKTAH